jgi:hypothetical protein
VIGARSESIYSHKEPAKGGGRSWARTTCSRRTTTPSSRSFTSPASTTASLQTLDESPDSPQIVLVPHTRACPLLRRISSCLVVLTRRKSAQPRRCPPRRTERAPQQRIRQVRGFEKREKQRRPASAGLTAKDRLETVASFQGGDGLAAHQIARRSSLSQSRAHLRQNRPSTTCAWTVPACRLPFSMHACRLRG